jgi:hypothetical protein
MPERVLERPEGAALRQRPERSRGRRKSVPFERQAKTLSILAFPDDGRRGALPNAYTSAPIFKKNHGNIAHS